MSDEAERFVRWYAHLAADAPLDRHAARALLRRALADREALAEFLLEQCTPALLGEFINRHWNDALSDALDSAALRLALRVMHAVWRIEDDRDRRAVLFCFRRGIIPSAKMMRQICVVVRNA